MFVTKKKSTIITGNIDFGLTLIRQLDEISPIFSCFFQAGQMCRGDEKLWQDLVLF